MPFKPTVVVYTGGGLQPYWLFREPWQFEDEKERPKAKKLSKAFQRFLQGFALDHGWTMDGTADLCRLLRLPGTYNRKQAEPVPVRYEVIETGRRYNPSDFEEFLELEADPELKAHVQGPAPWSRRPTFSACSAAARGCATAKMMPPRCRSRSGTACFPLWAVARTAPSSRTTSVNRIRTTSEVETTEKLKQAMGASGPDDLRFR